MAEFSKYPLQIDTTTELPKATDLVTPVKAEIVNRLRDAIVAIESELGIQPSGTLSSVRARLDDLEANVIDSGNISVYKDDTLIDPQTTKITFIGTVTVTAGAPHQVVIDTSPAGSAGGDLGGSYPNPNVLGLTNVNTNLVFNQGVDANIDGSNSINLGTTTATAIEIGRNGTNTTIGGNFLVNGNSTIGNASSDTVTMTARLVSDLIASTDDVRSLGASTLRYANIHATQFSARADTTDTIKSILTANAITISGTAFTIDGDNAVNVGNSIATSIGIGRSGITTTVTGALAQLTGAVTLTANAASSFTTSAGALTLTAAAASVWSTSAGALSISGFSALNLQVAAGNVVTWSSSAGTIQAGVTLATTGTGNINLPNNASAKFQIEGTSVGTTVTGANLDTVTNGSNADALHTHTTGVSNISVTGRAGEAIDVGELVAWDDSSGSPLVFKADANGSGELVNVVGIANSSVSSLASLIVLVSGERAIPDAEWDSVPTTGDVGKIAYLSETAGNWTLTAPSTTGSVAQKCGIVSQGGAGEVKVIIQIGDGVIN